MKINFGIETVGFDSVKNTVKSLSHSLVNKFLGDWYGTSLDTFMGHVHGTRSWDKLMGHVHGTRS